MQENIYIEINLTHLAENLKIIKNICGQKVKIAGIIKQNAYGHGFIPAAKRLNDAKTDFLGVNSAAEAGLLLQNNINKPRILILSNTLLPNTNLKNLIKKQVRFTVMDKALIKHLNKTAKTITTQAKIHVKIDTGMNRLGLYHKEAEKFITEIIDYKNIKLEGLYSHLSAAENKPGFTNRQINRFRQLISKLENKKIHIPLTHICNSSGLLKYPKARLDMVRTGILLYGIKPHPKLSVDVKPVLTLKSKIIFIKKIPKNSYVSYANTFKTKKEMLIGVIACGYAYGYPWNLSGSARIIVKGKKRRILGRICMDHMIVDLSGLENSVQIGDIVTLIGKDNHVTITAEELAKKSNTIPYEIVTRLSPTIKRYYID